MNKLSKSMHAIHNIIKKPLISNILWLFFDKFYGAILTLYLYSQIAIYFGVELFGVWNYIISFSTIIIAIGALGLNFIIVKRIKQNPIVTERIISNAFYFRFLFGLVVALLIFSIYAYIGVNYSEKYYWTIIFIFSSQIVLNANVFVFFNESNLKNKWTVVTRNVALSITFILKLLAIYLKKSIVFFAALNFIEILLFFFLITAFPKNKANFLNPKLLKRKVAKVMLKEGFPLLLAAVTVTLYLKIDQLIIGYLMDNEKVGIYASASRITEMLYVAPVIISNVFFPKIIEKYKNKQNKEGKNLLKLLFGSTLTVTIIIALIVSVFSKFIINFIFGSEYIEASEVLKIYAWSIVFMGLLVSSSKYLLVINRNDIIFKRELMGLISNVSLNFILIPKYGLLGAAWATFISYFLASYLSNIFFKELRPLMKDQVLALYYFIKKFTWKMI